ncbi:MAG: hypothetical protein PVH24_01690 [Candidatus Zixiibacteriota bacterium]
MPGKPAPRYIYQMSENAATNLLRDRLQKFDPDRYGATRALALYSAAITLADNDCMSEAADICVNHGIDRRQLYEIVLQSYLFLGFPRMLIAAEQLHSVLPEPGRTSLTTAISPSEAEDWFKRGMNLYNRVYDSNAERLRAHVENMAPEIFRWMIVEGYGKVLSRPGLNIIDRETSIIAFLTMENRRKQLFSHIRGALNVGAGAEIVRLVVDDIGDAAGDGYKTALELLDSLDAKP